MPAASLPALIAAIRLPDRHPTVQACDASLWVAPDLVLILADGSRIRPGLPGDGCHVLATVQKVMQSATDAPARTTVALSQIATEQEVASGCTGGGKAPAIWLTAGWSGVGAATSDRSVADVLPASGRVSLCRYSLDKQPILGTLAATGTATARAVASALTSISATPPSRLPPGCSSPPPSRDAPATDWLTIKAPPAPGPDQPALAPLLGVDLGGCHRVVAGASQSLLGYLGTGAAAALAALADHPTS